MRISTGNSLVSPIARTVFSWIARSNLTCIANGKSATSSKNSVPPLACWNNPCLSATAPVKLPFLWPKNSDSISSDGIAPQLTGTKLPSRRGLKSWIKRATTSLPVPDAPDKKTGACERANFKMVFFSGCMTAESPIKRLSSICCSGERSGVNLAALSWWITLRALSTNWRKRGSSSGLLTKSKAPSFNASIAKSILPCAVITAMGVVELVLICLTNSNPEPSGNFKSVKQKS